MTVIEQVMFFAACQECDWQSVLRSEAAIVEGMERTHRAHEHPQPSEQEFLSHYAADVTVPQSTERATLCRRCGWREAEADGVCDLCHQPSEPSDEWCDHHESPGSCPVFGCLNHEPSDPHVHEYKLRYVCACGEHSTGASRD